MTLDKIGLKQVVYFGTTELVELLLEPLEFLLLGKMLDSRLMNGKEIDSGSLEQLVKKQTKIKSNSKEYEYWVAIFSLISEFGEHSEIGFYLEDKFNRRRDRIDSLKDLEAFKQENNQCDVIIKNERKVYEFQLKRYRDEWTEKALFDFIKKKILQYSDPINYLIAIQSNVVGPISLEFLENLSSNLGKLAIKKDLGIICFTFNANNEHIITVRVYPDYRVTKQPFVSGSDQVKKLYNVQGTH
ncbi:MAG TPA: hypothetical protein DEP87_02275 [Candidatus Pacebacteria bacterium]|nr:hypothetical protein [Candidatus Paceibacterota bacterium]